MRSFKSAFIWILVGAVAVYAIAAAWIIRRYGVSQEAGWLGDMFGGINGFFAAVGAGAALYALRLQHREMDERTTILQQGQQDLARQTELISQQLSSRLRSTSMTTIASFESEISEKMLQALEDELSCDTRHLDGDALARATKAIELEKAAWEAHVEAWIELRSSFHPRQNCRSNTWMPTTERTRLNELRAREIEDLREWIATMHTKI